MEYPENLGNDMAYMPDPTVERGIKQGVHDAVRDMIRISLIGGTVLIVATIFFPDKLKKITRKII